MNNNNLIIDSLLNKSVQLARYTHHADFLQQCINNKKIPKGLSIHLEPHVSGNLSVRFLTRWNQILENASLDLARLLLSGSRHQAISLVPVINHTEMNLKATKDPTTFNIITNHVKRISNIEANKLSKKRIKKLNALGIANPGVPNLIILNSKTKRPSRRFTRIKKTLFSNSQSKYNVVNLSSVQLTEAEQSLLSKGLNFCPRPVSYDHGKLVDDTKQFSRRIRLRAHFSKPDLPKDNNTIINQSSYEHDESVTPNTLNISNHSQHSQFLSITQDTDHDERYRQFTPKSDWVPPKQSKVLETFIKSVENDIASF